MRLLHDIHLAYCTNIHRGENWAETFAGLQAHTLRVKQAVCPKAPYAIGLRLSAVAADELSRPETLREFQGWLERNQCYVFTVNGKRVFLSAGGISLTDAIDTRRSRASISRYKKVLSSKSQIKEGIKVAFHPLIPMKRYPGDD